MLTRNDKEHDFALLRALAVGLEHVLETDDRAMRELAGLAGRVIAVQLRDTNKTLYVYVTPDGLELSAHHEAEPDVIFAGGVFDFLALARTTKNGGPRGAGKVAIHGDLGTAQQVQTILANLRLDWEEFLSRYVGDVMAHQIGRTARVFTGWMSSAGSLLRQDLSEYLQHEIGLLPTRVEHDLFLDRVASLVRDIERAGMRLQRLSEKSGQT